jgi:hypothetical protein
MMRIYENKSDIFFLETEIHATVLNGPSSIPIVGRASGLERARKERDFETDDFEG